MRLSSKAAVHPQTGSVFVSIQPLLEVPRPSVSYRTAESKIRKVSSTLKYNPSHLLTAQAILNYTGAQCSPIGEALVPATTIIPTPSAGTNVVAPLQVATVPLVFPTGNVPGAVPKFSNLPACAVSHLSETPPREC